MDCYFHWMGAHSNPTSMNKLGEKDGCPVFSCPQCGLVSSPQPPLDEYEKIYTDPKNYWGMCVSVGYSSFEERFQHDYAVGEARVRNIVQVVRKGGASVLDVGCGNGALVRRLEEVGFKVSGVDLDEWTTSQAAEIIGDFQCYHGNFMEVDFDRTFDVLTFTDTFEHFLNPLECARRARSLLSEGGLIVVETPDTGSSEWVTQGLEWRHVKPLEHPFLFGAVHITALFEKAGMKIVDTRFTIPSRAVYYIR